MDCGLETNLPCPILAASFCREGGIPRTLMFQYSRLRSTVQLRRRGRFHGVLARQPYDKPRVAWLRFHIDLSAEFLRDDAVHDLQPQPGARTLRLGGEERVEDARQSLRGDARAVIANAHHQPI